MCASAQQFGTDILRHLTYTAPGPQALDLDLYRPLGAPGDSSLILAIPDIAESDGTDGRDALDEIGTLLSAEGYAVAVVTCRAANDHPYPAQLDDIRAVLRWLNDHATTYHLNMKRIATLGISGGAQLAALTAMQHQPNMPAISAVVDLAGPMDLTATFPSLSAKIALQIYLDASRDDNPQRYTDASPIHYVNTSSPPFLIIHGTADTVIPYTQASKMSEVLRKAHVPCSLLPLTGHGHEFPSLATPVGAKIAQALLQFLKRNCAPLP